MSSVPDALPPLVRAHVTGRDILLVGLPDASLALDLSRHGYTVTAVDRDEDAVAAAREASSTEAGGPTFTRLGGADLPDDADADTIVFDRSLGHLLRREPLIEQARRIVRTPGSIIVIDEPGVREHGDHVDAFPLSEIVALLEPHAVEISGTLVLAAASTDGTPPMDAAALIPIYEQLLARADVRDGPEPPAEAALRARLSKAVEARKRTEEDNRRLRRRLARHRKHWSWRIAVAVRDARRSPRAFFALPWRILRILAGAIRRRRG